MAQNQVIWLLWYSTCFILRMKYSHSLVDISLSRTISLWWHNPRKIEIIKIYSSNNLIRDCKYCTLDNYNDWKAMKSESICTKSNHTISLKCECIVQSLRSSKTIYSIVRLWVIKSDFVRETPGVWICTRICMTPVVWHMSNLRKPSFDTLLYLNSSLHAYNLCGSYYIANLQTWVYVSFTQYIQYNI
jgi:hypothetical protein